MAEIIEESKVYYPEEIDDVPLPETTVWENIANRPRSLQDLDPETQKAINEIEVDFLNLGDLAFLNSITTTQISDSAITTPKLATGSIIAAKIAAGAITTSKLDAQAVTADKINVGDLFSENISATGSITGALIRTSSGGDRVEIDDVSDSIKIFNSNDLRIEIIEDRITFFEEDGSAVVSMYASPLGNFLMAGTSFNDILISSNRDLTLNAEDDLFIFADDDLSINTGALADDIFIGLGSNTFMQFGDGRVYLDTYIDMKNNNIVRGGNITCVSLTETSDIRRKKNIKDLNYGLKELLQLRPIQYQFKNQKTEPGTQRKSKYMNGKGIPKIPTVEESHLGFSAQDVYKIMPELTLNADGVTEETARLYTTQMIPVIVNAIQELSRRLGQG